METEHIKNLTLDGEFAKYRSVREIDGAINDLLIYNYFSVVESGAGPYEVLIDIADNRLIFNIKPSSKKAKSIKFTLPIRSFRSIIKDYFIVCENHQEMLKTGAIDKIEALDMGRRSLHNEGAEILLKLLENKVNTDFETARRIFTIITVLHQI